MKFASLGSGSEGNSLLISGASGSTRTTVMLDCGFGIRETEQRLARLGVTPADLSGILVTHEHQDHVGGVFKFARRHRIPVWLSFGTWQAVRQQVKDVTIHFCRDSERFAIGDLEFSPYTVPHDAREPLQFMATDGDRRLGVLTDVGQSTAHLVAALAGCHALMLECNHDREMLANSAYPYFLKQRIGGEFGHLSNQTAAEILARLDTSQLRRVVAAHLSKQNNTPELARSALSGVAGSSRYEILVAYQADGLGWTGLAD